MGLQGLMELTQKLNNTGHSHGSELTWEQLAMVLVGRPMEGAHATSRTQSLCASSFCSSFHWPSSSSLIGEIRENPADSSPGDFPTPPYLPNPIGFIEAEKLFYLSDFIC